MGKWSTWNSKWRLWTFPKRVLLLIGIDRIDGKIEIIINRRRKFIKNLKRKGVIGRIGLY